MALRLASWILLLALATFAQQPDAPKGNPADDRLYDEVRGVLASDRDVRGAAIDVSVKDGAIVLKGRVRDEKAREKATKIVTKMKGVKSVENQLKLFGEK